MAPTQKRAHYYTKSTSEAIATLASTATGLTSQEAQSRKEKYGTNTLPDSSTRSLVAIFLSQFNSILIYVLVAAAGIAYWYNHIVDVYVIVTVIVINAVVGFIQEYRAEQSINSLKELVLPQTTVYRDGALRTLLAAELVPGDVIFLEQGNRIPADARILSCKNFQTIEASLTGESNPVTKKTTAVSPETSPADQSCMVWMGSSVASGTAYALVSATGTATMLGGIAQNLESIQKTTDHFKTKTNLLARQMGGIALVATVVTFVVGYSIRSFSLEEMLGFTIATLVSAIPESLPVVLTVVLALSAQRMARKNAIVRRLSATETLTAVDTIITDKTGTLTQNKMTAAAIALPQTPQLTLATTQEEITLSTPDKKTFTRAHAGLAKLFQSTAFGQGVRIERDENGTEYLKGDPTEVSLAELGKRGMAHHSYTSKELKKLSEELPFSQKHKWRACLLQTEEGTVELMVMGAPERVLAASEKYLDSSGKIHSFDKASKKESETVIESLTEQAMRVIAVAYKPFTDSKKTPLSHNHVAELVYLGAVGISDPPRPEVKAALQKAKTAGITTIMATGDHPLTARAIAVQVGLISSDQKDMPSLFLTEQELQELSDEAVLEKLTTVRVFSRMTPEAKLRIAKLLQEKGHIIAMTGDGVNDAPSLKQANIGFAMGKTGADVAREAADIILTDDNFASILNAIEEGRTQFLNVRRTSFYLIATNIGESLTLVLFLLIGFPIPLLAKQILWLNLVASGVTDIALATEPIHSDVLNRPPTKQSEPLLTKKLTPFLILITGTMVLLSILVFWLFIPQGLETARTAVFVVLVGIQLWNVLNLRSMKKSIFILGFFTNKAITIALAASLVLLTAALYIPSAYRVFEFVPLNVAQYLLLLALSGTVLVVVELHKYWTSLQTQNTEVE